MAPAMAAMAGVGGENDLGLTKRIPSHPPPAVPGIDLEGLVRNTDQERARIVDVLRMCHGNQTKAAEVLGISRRTLVSRLTEYDLPRPRKTVSAHSNRSEKGRP